MRDKVGVCYIWEIDRSILLLPKFYLISLCYEPIYPSVNRFGRRFDGLYVIISYKGGEGEFQINAPIGSLAYFRIQSAVIWSEPQFSPLILKCSRFIFELIYFFSNQRN